MSNPAPQSLIGKTIRWTFSEGPVKGKTFEHVFAKDGSVAYRMLDPQGKPGKDTHEKPSGVEKVGDSAAVVSYLTSSGYTLTVVLNFADMSVISFASNEKTWSQASGSFEVVG
jgi:hypothetical protein